MIKTMGLTMKFIIIYMFMSDILTLNLSCFIKNLSNYDFFVISSMKFSDGTMIDLG
jgi:hypothetical protein